ncbi:TPA: hypothetical protein ACH3X1_004857 [Trebouxia sp. C0004]
MRWSCGKGEFRASMQSSLSATISSPPMQILTCSENKSIGVYELESNSLIRHWQGHQKAVTRISYMPLAGLAVSGSRDTSVKLWDRNFVESAAAWQYTYYVGL